MKAIWKLASPSAIEMSPISTTGVPAAAAGGGAPTNGAHVTMTIANQRAQCRRTAFS